MLSIRSAAALLALVALASCDKVGPRDITAAAPGARIKFFNFSVNGPGVNFYANDQKLTAIASATGAESTTGTTYTGVGSGGYYSGVTPGSYTLSGRISAATDKDLPIGSVQTSLVDGKSYSFYLSGFYDATTKKTDAFVVEDTYPDKIDYSTAYVRFVNAISNSSPMTLYAKSTVTGIETAIGGVVAYKSAGTFVPIPGGVYDLSTRTAGSTTNVITRTGVSFGNGTVATITARGDITVTSTTATNRPFLDNTANR